MPKRKADQPIPQTAVEREICQQYLQALDHSLIASETLYKAKTEGLHYIYALYAVIVAQQRLIDCLKEELEEKNKPIVVHDLGNYYDEEVEEAKRNVGK